MKKRLLPILLIVCLLTLSFATLSACKKTDNANTNDSGTTDVGDGLTLNVIDDEYRNWYEIFVYSFFDTDNNGIGDLNGVTTKLDYVKDIGFNGIWLMPIHPSPTYHKYDVTDYYAIDPVYGNLDDFDRLISEAHARGIRVIIDLVFNHTSSEHPWFKEACEYIRKNGAPGGRYGEFYNFSNKEQSGYSRVSGTNYYYEARFWSGMPDLNLNSPAVKAEMEKIMRFWLEDHKVDGFRLDAVTSYYTGNLNKNVEFLGWINTTAKRIYGNAYIVGEAWEGTDTQISNYYKSGCDSFFLFTGAQGTGKLASFVKQQNARGFASWVIDIQNTYGNVVLAPFLGNHDTMRPASFMPGKLSVKMAGGLLSMMSGGIFVYYGEEIGMISKDGGSSDPRKRIAMKWDDGVYPGWCYTPPENIVVTDQHYTYPSVAVQLEDADSILTYYKQAMRLRNCFPAIARGTIKASSIKTEDMEVAAITKTYGDETVTILINLSREDTHSVNVGSLALVAQLNAASGTTVTADADGTVNLPPCSIAILK